MDNKVKVTVEYEHEGESVKKVVDTDFVICIADSEQGGESNLQTMIVGRSNPLKLLMAAAKLQENVKDAVMKGFLEKNKAHAGIHKLSDGLGDILDALMEVLK